MSVGKTNISLLFRPSVIRGPWLILQNNRTRLSIHTYGSYDYVNYKQKILKVPGSFRFFLFGVFFIIVFVISGKGSLEVNWGFFTRRSRLIEVRLNQAFGLFSLFGFSPSRASWFRYVFFFLFGNFVGILFIL